MEPIIQSAGSLSMDARQDSSSNAAQTQTPGPLAGAQAVVHVIDAPPPPTGHRRLLRRMAKVLVVVIVVSLLIAIGVSSKNSRRLPELLLWIEHRPVVGFLIFILIYFVCTGDQPTHIPG
jgi:hypothetical protein